MTLALKPHPHLDVRLSSATPPYRKLLPSSAMSPYLEHLPRQSLCVWGVRLGLQALYPKSPKALRLLQGHFHLSHNYVDSISVVGGCAFVQTGVIGACNRDGNRQSRLLRGAHSTGFLRSGLSSSGLILTVFF